MFSRYIKQQAKCELTFSLNLAHLCIACHGQYMVYTVTNYRNLAVILEFFLAFTIQWCLFFSHFCIYLLSICTALHLVQALIIFHLKHFRNFLTIGFSAFLINLPSCCQFFKIMKRFLKTIFCKYLFINLRVRKWPSKHIT